jgi:hypothetical protein
MDIDDRLVGGKFVADAQSLALGNRNVIDLVFEPFE